ncbi:MAG TPA: HAD-IIB family hydrolase [Longimicrobiales bacterium]|nr:HAD-IIB family hydrolase [Longimicrobiales bacterium]
MSEQPAGAPGRGLDVLSLSIHGLVRAQDIELGRDPDTGGQILYVVDQAKALVTHGQARVQVVTRQVIDKRLDDVYAEPREEICPGARIVRIPFGPRRYLRKESLWPHLDSMVDQLTRHVRATERVPDVVHGHYADAGYVGAQLAKILGIPFVFTGHSLGRVKRERLLAGGQDAETIDERFHFTRRIEAEEQALETAAAVITSTRQEVGEQYEGYDHYRPDRMHVIPPGLDLSRYAPPTERPDAPPIAAELERFLAHPERPILLAIARPDERKNFIGLVEAYARTPDLRDTANLVLVMGNREDLREMPSASRRVIEEVLGAIERHDLYGYVAYPKRHGTEDVPDLYRWAARSGGLFVNPAFTEPFGLTLLEAAASGLPVVATDDGGPADIVGACENGVLVDSLEPLAIGRAMKDALADRARWQRWSEQGLDRVHRAFSWKSHAERYAEVVGGLLEEGQGERVRRRARRLERMDRMLVADIDDTLIGDGEALEALAGALTEAGDRVAFAVATGRTLPNAVRALNELEEQGMRSPNVLITASGTMLSYGARKRERDRSWERQIDYRWEPARIREVLEGMPDIEPGPREGQNPFRVQYRLSRPGRPSLAQVRRRLRQAGVEATALLDHETSLEVIPVRASPGLAIRFLCYKWNLAPERLLVAGDSGNDLDMLEGDTLGVVVGNHTGELDELRGRPRIYFAEGCYAWGVLEGIRHYDFFGRIRVPETEEDAVLEEGQANGA